METPIRNDPPRRHCGAEPTTAITSEAGTSSRATPRTTIRANPQPRFRISSSNAMSSIAGRSRLLAEEPGVVEHKRWRRLAVVVRQMTNCACGREEGFGSRLRAAVVRSAISARWLCRALDWTTPGAW